MGRRINIAGGLRFNKGIVVEIYALKTSRLMSKLRRLTNACIIYAVLRNTQVLAIYTAGVASSYDLTLSI